MKTVLLKFSGPLQSWGTYSHFEIRHTDSHPSKSGVIGMIAAGLGYRREEEDGLKRLNSLQFAVRVDQPGQILRDYHTAKKYKGNGDLERTYVTNRYYLQDAVFIVALGSDDEALIKDVLMAISKPYFPLYLGRRALPPTSDLLLDVVDSDPITVLRTFPWQASAWYQKKKNKILQIFADEKLLSDVHSVKVRNDEVVSFSQRSGREFCPRREARITVEVIVADSMKEHDAFSALGDE